MKKLVLAALFVLTIWAVARWAPRPGKPTSSDTVEVDLGVLTEGGTVRREVRWRNSFNTEFTVESSRASCPCLQAEVAPDTVEPDEDLVIALTLRVPRTRGASSLSVWIRSHHDELIALSVSFQSRGLPYIEEPYLIAHPEPATGQWSVHTSLVLPPGNEDVRVSLSAVGSGVEVALGDPHLTERGTEHPVVLTGTDGKNWTRQRGLAADPATYGANLQLAGPLGVRDLIVRVSVPRPDGLDVSPRKVIALRGSSIQVRLRPDQPDDGTVYTAATEPADCARISMDSEHRLLLIEPSLDAPAEFDIVLRHDRTATHLPVALQETVE